MTATPPSRTAARQAYGLLLLPPLFWAGNVVLARGITGQIPPVALAFFRWTLATLVIWPFAWRRVRADWPTLRRRWPILLLLGVLGISSFNTLLYIGVQTTTAINGALMQTAMPAIIVLVSLLLFRERITPLQTVAVLISVSGALLVVSRGQLSALLGLELVIGDVQIFIAVILYALYSALLRKRPLLHPLSFIAATFTLGTVGLLPFYLWERQTAAAFTLTPNLILSILYVAIFPSILAYLCWNRGIELIGANRGGLFINLTPLFASFLSVLFLGEAVQLYHFLGLLLIFSGMLLFNRQTAVAQSLVARSRKPAMIAHRERIEPDGGESPVSERPFPDHTDAQ